MVNKCIVDTCNTVKAGDGVTMHRLPADPPIRGVWFHALLDKTGQTVFREEDEICSKHFNPENFSDVDGISVLRSDAVPFDFCPDDGVPRAKRLKRNETVPSQCSVFSCKNVSNETLLTRPNLTYYLFPKSKTLLTSWKQFCNKTDDDFSESCVCSDHFTPTDFTNDTETSTGSSKMLKPNAVPSIYKTEIKSEELIEEGEELITPQNVLQMDFAADDNNTPEDKICSVENCEFNAAGRNDVDYYPNRRYTTSDEMAQVLAKIDRYEAEEGNPQDTFMDAGIYDDPDFEPEQIEENDHDSDSDIALEDGENDDMKQDEAGIRFYTGKDGETIWASSPVALPTRTIWENIIKTLPGPRGQAGHCKTKLDCFLQIITHEMIANIVKYTNIFIERKKSERQEQAEKSKGTSKEIDVRERDYKATTATEISALLGALFLIGVKRGSRANFEEYWNSNGTGLMILRANFSLTRVKFLLRALRFDDLNTRAVRQATDKLAPVREVMTAFITNSQSAFSLGEFVTIDEMLVPFRGRCSFIQYMASKPAKYGLKIYAMCDARIFYTYNLEVYCGKQQLLSNNPYDVVLRLVQCVEGSNRNITTDKYFSSFELAECLLSKGLTFLGAIRPNIKHLPPEFVTVKKTATVGDHLFGCQPDKTLVSLITKRKKAVVLLSTMHDANEIDENTKKPLQIMDYNFSKGGVDTVDLMCSRISASKRTQRWPVTVFFRLLDLAGINSLRIFQFNTADGLTRRTYLQELALDLMKENLKERANLICLPKDIKLFLEPYRASQPPPTTKRGICYLCGTKKNIKTRRECGGCEKNVCLRHSTTTVRCDNCQMSENENNDMETD